MSFSSCAFAMARLAFALIDDALIRAGIDLGADLSSFDLCIVIAAQFLDDAGYIGPDDDRQFRIDRACGVYVASDVTDRNRRRLISNRGVAAERPPDAQGCSEKQCRDPNENPAPRRKSRLCERLPDRASSRRKRHIRQSFPAFGCCTSAKLRVHFAFAPGIG